MEGTNLPLRILHSEDSALHLMPLLLGFEVERLAAVWLDRRLAIVGSEVLSIGCPGHTIVNPRHILRRALLVNAHALVLGHNHPSGDPEPSIDDIEVTLEVQKAGKVVGIDLIDHIVIGGPGRWVSLAQRSMML